MIADTNSVVVFGGNMIGGLLGSDSLVLIGIIFFFCVAMALIWSRAKAGTVIMVGAACAVMFGLWVQEFTFLFWIAILISIIVLINALRKFWSGY